MRFSPFKYIFLERCNWVHWKDYDNQRRGNLVAVEQQGESQ